ncbi:hypothetical protein PROFUN_07605 [Planoprotostelium fungivorum]|uniref:Anaphase-promoting complex subunit 4-like WD40 domain-containing protein n=1 Tax=Planoprotostelium fungivorum TaxID=1890364 RepID=A0A2P6NK32_9EUKA|nr:hypothetical protein PROFUN_07605 [Planoprotostelium fungivorum]
MNTVYSSDDDEEAQYEPLYIIQQYLSDNGLVDTLATLQSESGQKYRPSSSALGGILETMIFDHRQKILSKQLEATESTKEDVDEALLERGDKTFAKEKVREWSPHTSNILSVSFSKEIGSTMLASGSTDKTFRLSDYSTGEVVHEFSGVHNAAVISIDYNPVPSLGHLLLTGTMDGSHCVVDTRNKSVVQYFRDHKKYVVVTKWHPSGLLFATGSHDHTVNLYRLKDQSLTSQEPFELIEKIPFNLNVETIAFTPDGARMYVGIRDSNYLQIFDLNNGNVKTKFNMNAAGDDHVSFSAVHMMFSPTDPQYLLVATDRSRSILYREGESVPVRNFWGANNDLYSNPRCAWHHSGRYVYTDHDVHCWEVSNQTAVSRMKGHTSIVRDLTHHGTENLLATCSFDKTVKLWSA